MFKKVISLSLAFGLSFSQCFWAPSNGREISKAGIIFEQVKDGVVTLFTSAGHGSGFLIDKSGLILTNSHVVNETSGHLRVKFGPNEIVEAKILENDRDHDVAIVWANLDEIKKYKVLEPFQNGNEPLVIVGEQVLAIGSPIERETLEKTLTTGVVGKFDNLVINHDATINPGNSGGPLVNYDGQVVGINTFRVIAENSPGVAGAVPISLAFPILRKAKEDITKTGKPSSKLLPDVPIIDFPISQFLKDNPELFKKRTSRSYNFEANYFKVSVLTPPQGYRQVIKIQDKELAKRKKRATKKGFTVQDDEYNYKNLQYYNYNKPLVTFMLIPKPKLTTGSKVFNTLSFNTFAGASVATFGAATPLMLTPFMMGKKEIKKDFLSLEIQTPDGKTACTPVEAGRIPFETNLALLTGYTYQNFIDKSYVGVYSYDSKCFEYSEPLKMVIDIEGKKDNDYTIHLPDRVKSVILDDFKPYQLYVANQNTPQQSVAKAEAKTQLDKDYENLQKILHKN